MFTLRTVTLAALLLALSSMPLQGDTTALAPALTSGLLAVAVDSPVSSLDPSAAAVGDPTGDLEVARSGGDAAVADSIVIHCLYCVNRPETGEFRFTVHPTQCKGGDLDGGTGSITAGEGEGCTPCAVNHGGGGHLLGGEQWECNTGNWQPGSCPTMSCQGGGDPEEFAALSDAIYDRDFDTVRSLLSVASSAYFDPAQRTVFMTDCATERVTAFRLDPAAAAALMDS